MKTQKFKEDYSDHVMYEFDSSKNILVVEAQENGTEDHIFLIFQLNEGEKAYFGKEYVPYGVKVESTKKPDITAIVENPVNKKTKWFIYDVKDTVINAKTAVKLCAQWHSGIEHVSTEYLQNLFGYHIEDSLGMITRFWDKDKLKEEIARHTEKINNRNQLMTARKSLQKVGEYKNRIKAMQYIIDGVFEDCEEITGNRKKYVINYVDLVTSDRINYKAKMEIHI